MSERSCTDCRLLKPGIGGVFLCGWEPEIQCAAYGGISKRTIVKGNMLTDCPTWEPKPVELTREQRLEAAISKAIEAAKRCRRGDITCNDLEDIVAGLEKIAAASAAPSEPTEEEMRRVVLDAGWAKIYDDRNQGGRWFERRNGAAGEGVTLQAAYERVMRERGGE